MNTDNIKELLVSLRQEAAETQQENIRLAILDVIDALEEYLQNKTRG
jgi:molecular chaperone GrpE (heat shock protein)